MFCPRCGATQPESARFCGRCGQPIARRPAETAHEPAGGAPPEPATAGIGGAPATPVVEAPTVAERPGAAEWPPPPVSHDGLDRRWLGAGIAAALVASVVVVLLVTGVFGSGDKAPRAAAAAPTPAAPTATSTPAPATPTPTRTPSATATATQPVAATVKRTCGVNGSGDCHLSVRAQPDASSAELRRLKEGDTLRLSCQTRGESVHSSALGASSTVWSKTTRGGYVASVYVSGSGIDPRRITLPRC